MLGQAIGASPCGGALAVEGAREAVLVRAIFRDNSVAVSPLCRSIHAVHVPNIVILLALGDLCLGGELEWAGRRSVCKFWSSSTERLPPSWKLCQDGIENRSV